MSVHRAPAAIVTALLLGPALGALGATRAAAATRLFITNHVNSNQIGDLVEWQGGLVAATLGGLVRVDPSGTTLTKLLSSPGGLPSNRLLCVAASPSGSLWAGTAEEGIARLKPDGTYRRTLTSFDGLPSDRVQTLYVRGDSVWVGTSGGVALFTEQPSGQVSLRRSDTSASTGGALPSDDVLAFQQVGDTLWTATSAGLATFAGGAWRSRAAALGVAVRALALHEDTLWAATSAGPRRYQAGAFVLVASGHSGPSLTLASDGPNLDSGSGSLGVYRYTGSGWVAFGSTPLGYRPNALLTLSTGDRWAGADVGLAHHDPSSGSWDLRRSEGPAVNGTQRATVSGGSVWFATGNFVPPGGSLGAVLRYDGAAWSALTPASTGGSLQATSVFAILGDRDGKLWLGHCCSAGNPLPRTERFDPSTGVWDTLGVTNIYAFSQAPSGHVYAGSVEHGNGVYVLEGSTAALLDSLTPTNTQGGVGPGLASNNLRGIAFDPAGRGWFAHASSGLDLWNGGGTVTNHADDVWVRLGTGFQSLQTTAVVATGPSAGWVGTIAGVTRIRNDLVDGPASGAANAELPSPLVRDLAWDGAGHLWVATLGGIARVDVTTGAAESWTTADGLSGDDVRSLAWDAARGVLWVGTTDGISEILPDGDGEAFTDASYLYPSPLRGATPALKLGGITGAVTGEIRDATGSLIKQFACDPARNDVWNATLADGSPAASGIYVVVLRDGERARRLKVAVIR